VPDDAPVLYFGGIYDWYDPLVLLEALPQLLEADPRTVVLFVEHPHPELTPLGVAARTREVADERGWLGRQVRFEGWRPFHRRFELPAVSDLAVVCHRPGIETDLSLRTRLVDLLWLGLPMVVTRGGTMARVVHETGAGEVVLPADRERLAGAVRRLLDDPEQRQRAAAAARDWSRGRTWPRVAAPLLEFAQRPWRDPHRTRFVDLDGGGGNVAQEPLARRLRRVVRRFGGSR
jgi:glycosyltransferase involved in cell wall biosynthesis